MCSNHNWKDEHKRLWDALVPEKEPPDTLQGELIKIIGKLVAQAYQKRNENWCKDYEKMFRYVSIKISDDPIFSKEDQFLIKDKIEEIIHNKDQPDLSGDGSPYYIVHQKVIDWCMANPEPIPYSAEPNLTYDRKSKNIPKRTKLLYISIAVSYIFIFSLLGWAGTFSGFAWLPAAIALLSMFILPIPIFIFGLTIIFSDAASVKYKLLSSLGLFIGLLPAIFAYLATS